jgi:hypothetical protein
MIQGDKLEVMHDTKHLISLDKVWFYDVGSNTLVKIQTPAQLQAIFDNEVKNPPAYLTPADKTFRNKLRDWLDSN